MIMTIMIMAYTDDGNVNYDENNDHGGNNNAK